MPLNRMSYPVEVSSSINMAPSLPSTGTTTPITPRGSGQFSVHGSHEALHQKFGYAPGMATVPNYSRHIMPVMANSTQLDPNGYDWSMVAVKQEGGNGDDFMNGLFDASNTHGMLSQNAYKTWHLPGQQGSIYQNNKTDSTTETP